MQYSPLYIAYLFSTSLIEDIVDIRKSDGICSLFFVLDDQDNFCIDQSFLSKIQDLHK